MSSLKPDTDLDPRRYTVSVHVEVFDAAAYEAGEPRERDTEVDQEDFDCEELMRLQDRYGFSEPSSSHLPVNGSYLPWFKTTTPREDREHFEQGVDRFYSFHLHAVDGNEPALADLQRVGDYFGIRSATGSKTNPRQPRAKLPDPGNSKPMPEWEFYLRQLASTPFMEAVRALFDREAAKFETPPARVGVYLAGGAGVHFWTRRRVSGDVDAEFTQRYLPGDEMLVFKDVAGEERGVYIDRQYNPMFALMHEDYRDRAVPAGPALGGAPVFDIRVLAPVDLAISKLARWSPTDQEDVSALAEAGLLDADELEVRAREALVSAIGMNPRMVEINLNEALDRVRQSRPRLGV